MIRKVCSYAGAFIAGIYFLCLCEGNVDCFMIMGFVVSLVLTFVAAAPYLPHKPNNKK